MSVAELKLLLVCYDAEMGEGVDPSIIGFGYGATTGRLMVAGLIEEYPDSERLVRLRASGMLFVDALLQVPLNLDFNQPLQWTTFP